jgi:hypothetical protein
MAWEIENRTKALGTKHEFADALLQAGQLVTGSMTVDTFTFYAPGQEIESVALGDSLVVEDEDDITIWLDGERVFRGRVTAIRARGDGRSESVEYTLSGPWWWLENTTAWQEIAVLASEPDFSDPESPPEDPGADFAWELQKISSLVLYQGIEESEVEGIYQATRLSTGEQISELIQRIGTAGAPLTVGTIEGSVPAPLAEVSDVSFAELIRQVARWHPDSVGWFDYSTETPTFNFRKVSNLSAVSVSVAEDADIVTDLRINKRQDGRVKGVTIFYPQRRTIDGEVYVDPPIIDSAGLAMGNAEVMSATIELPGSRGTYQRQEIETETYPEDGETDNAVLAAWWKKKDPRLAGIPVADLSVWAHEVEVTDDSGAELEEVPRELLHGGITDWMADGFGQTILRVAVKARASVTYTGTDAEIRKRFGAGMGILLGNHAFAATNAVTKEYKNLTGVEQAEDPPGGLAAAVYAAANVIHWDASLTIKETEVSGVVAMGDKLNLTNGQTAWATMNAMVNRVVWDIPAGVTRVTTGRPGYLGPQDLIELLRAQRGVKLTARHKERAEGQGTGNSVEVRGAAKGPEQNSSPEPDFDVGRFTAFIEGDPTTGFQVGVREGTVVETGANDLTGVAGLDAVTVADGTSKKFWVKITLAEEDADVPYREMEGAVLESGDDWPSDSDTEYFWRLFTATRSGEDVEIDAEWVGDVSFCVPTGNAPEDAGYSGYEEPEALMPTITFKDCDGGIVDVYDPEIAAPTGNVIVTLGNCCDCGYGSGSGS